MNMNDKVQIIKKHFPGLFDRTFGRLLFCDCIDISKLTFDRYSSFKDNLIMNYNSFEDAAQDIREKYKNIGLDLIYKDIQYFPFNNVIWHLGGGTAYEFEDWLKLSQDRSFVISRIEEKDNKGFYDDFTHYEDDEYFSLYFEDYLTIKKKPKDEYPEIRFNESYLIRFNTFLYINLYIEYLLGFSLDDMCERNKKFILNILSELVSYSSYNQKINPDYFINIDIHSTNINDLIRWFNIKNGLNIGFLILDKILEKHSIDELWIMYFDSFYRSVKMQKYPEDYNFDEEEEFFNSFIEDYNNYDKSNLKWYYELDDPETFLSHEQIEKFMNCE